MNFVGFTLATILALVAPAHLAETNSTYTNPILPGWHSDPSCVFVPEYNNTFFCATSTFVAFPGYPIYASKDLINWKLASNAFNRPSQFPDLGTYTGQQHGLYAPTLRYRNGTFYATVVSVGGVNLAGLVFKTTNPYDEAAWEDPVEFAAAAIDADIFWDDDGQAYVTYAGIVQSTIDLETGATGSTYSIWNGTGGVYPEGPHIYKKDGYYYLMIAEGGTELGHSETIARSKSVAGPYQSYSGNPILTNRNTTEYFQTVGHADLFQDGDSNWWGVALSTRSGPAWKNYPMGRESVLFPVTWNEGEWPVLQPVRGVMSGWPLPPPDKEIPGENPFLEDPDAVDFEPGSEIPKNFMYWRFPSEGAYTVSPPAHPNTLQLQPSKASLTGPADFEPSSGITFISRRQTDTLFTYSVDISFTPKVQDEEAGVTVFLTQYQHIDLGIVQLPPSNGSTTLAPHFRFRVTGTGNYEGSPIRDVVDPVPTPWLNQTVRLRIEARNDTHYAFSAAPSDGSQPEHVIAYAPATIVSGGTGPFTGTLVGAYATSNGGNGTTPAFIGKWRYKGQGQKIGNDLVVPFTPFTEI